MMPNAYRMFNFDLGETADAIRETVHDFSSHEIAPRADEIDKSNQFPRDLWPKIGAHGLHGITVEEEYGGSGVGYLQHCIGGEEISRASAAVGLSYGAHSNLCGNQLRRHGNEEQKRENLPKQNSGERVGGCGMSESGAGHDAGARVTMQGCLDVVMPYVHERKQFVQPIGSFQLVQGKIADMYTTMNASRAYVYAVAKACDRGETTREDAAGAILYASEKATQCALDAIQLLGGNGYINDYPTGRLLRHAKLYEIGAGTSEIRRMLIGRELFEKSA